MNSDNSIRVKEGWAIVKNHIIELEEGWAFIYKSIIELRKSLEARYPNCQVTVDESLVLYTIVHSMCTQKGRSYSDQLYDRCRDSIKEYITSMVSPALKEQSEAQLMLRELVKCWKIHNAMLHWIKVFFEYLDQFFFNKSSVASISELGIMYFRDLLYSEIRINVKNAAIAIVDHGREGEQIDGTLLKDVVAIFVELDMDFYESDFEVAMLEHTGAYYNRKGASWILEGSSYKDYMSKVEECLIREKDRVVRYLHGTSEQKVLEKVKEGLLSCYMTHFLEDEHSGCLALLRENRNDDLVMMRRLFDGLPNGWQLVANTFKRSAIAEVTPLFEHVEDYINVATKDKRLVLKEVAAFVVKVIQLRDLCRRYAVDVFQQVPVFSFVSTEVFKEFCNKRIAGTSTAQWLAILCDSLLEKDSDNKMLGRDNVIQNVVEFVEYLSDKELFANFYRKKLIDRVTCFKSVNVNLEKSILSKLTKKCACECAWELTSQMAGMRNDCTNSQEMQSRFETYLHNNRNIHPAIEFTATVLTTEFWPPYKCSQIHLPSEMLRCVEVFQDFYSTETPHRKLRWIYSLGFCNIIGKFDGGPIEMIATTYQTAILLLFNESQRLTFSHIKTQLNFSEEEAVGLLYSLACAKYKILVKHPYNTTVATTDYFEINSKFTVRNGTGTVKLPMRVIDEKKKAPEDSRLIILKSILNLQSERGRGP